MNDATRHAPPEPADQPSRRRRRRSRGGVSLVAQGEPMLWITGGCLAIAMSMILGLLALILWFGTGTFWPGPVLLVQLLGGSPAAEAGPPASSRSARGPVFLGEVTRSEWHRMTNDDVERLPQAVRAAARAEVDEHDGWALRRLLRTGNFELTQTHFHWIDDFAVAAQQQPAWALVFERVEWGRFYGIPRAFSVEGRRVADAAGLVGDAADEARQAIWDLVGQYHAASVERRLEIKRREKYELGAFSHREEDARLAMRRVELSRGTDSPEYAEAKEHFEAVRDEVEKQYVRVRGEIDALRAENKKYQITVVTAQGQETSIQLSDIVRVYPANQLSLGDKFGVYFSRWWEFLWDDPREANSEGGVWPAIVGTVTMTMIMAMVVVPFGILAALYLREYAKAGTIVSAVRIAINNLAGVPSIVFGVFGLGFFCYIVGGSIDNFFYPAHVADGNPVFGKGALVWASLTLALLTLPVVIVAAEEALSAVPNSMREGSYACGAGKWQTIRRIVLPHAMPGIMTGMILAMARGAGEVAPLMLVGAVKLAPERPVDGFFPFVHPDRSFMHLGFHVYDLGFQSQNSEAAKPMVYTTALLLIFLIAALNVLAIWLRGRLRKRFVSGQF